MLRLFAAGCQQLFLEELAMVSGLEPYPLSQDLSPPSPF